MTAVAGHRPSQSFQLALLEEILLFLAFTGLGTIMWLWNETQTDWWRGAIPEIAFAYAMRFGVEFWLRYKKKPLLQLTLHDTV